MEAGGEAARRRSRKRRRIISSQTAHPVGDLPVGCAEGKEPNV